MAPVRLGLSALVAALGGCGVAPMDMPDLPEPCTGSPIVLEDGSVTPIEHEPAGNATVTGVVVSSESDGTQYELVLDVEGAVHRFFFTGTVNWVPIESGDTIDVVYVSSPDGFTSLAIAETDGRRVAFFVHALAPVDVGTVVTDTAAWFGTEATVMPFCAASGGACGRAAVRYLVQLPGGLATSDGGSLSLQGWRLESDDTGGGEACGIAPRSAIELEAIAQPPPPPEPPACTGAPALALGGTTFPAGAPPIEHTLGSVSSGDAIVVSITPGSIVEPLRIGLEVDGAVHEVAIPMATVLPPLEAGDAVQFELRGSDVLELHGADGAAAIYVRRRGFGFPDATAYASALGVEASIGNHCRFAEGGQCGRGVILRTLTLAGRTAAEGGILEVALDGATLRASVHALADDNDGWADGSVCAIGALVAEAVDAVRVPSP